MQGCGPPPSSILPPLPLNDNAKLLLKGPFAHMNHKAADENRRAHHNQGEEHNLLEGVDSAEIDGPEA